MSDRVPLLERVNGDWTDFEAQLFNLLAKELPGDYLFSRRLAVTQVMLDAMDKYVELERMAK